MSATGELAGLLFDGNLESLANEFLYGERSVCVHPQAIIESLRRVDAATRLCARSSADPGRSARRRRGRPRP